MTLPDPGLIERRLAELALLSDEAGRLTRLAFGPSLAQAQALVLGWMRAAGMQAGIDAAGNVAGRYEGASPGAPALLLGSHLDTVPDAGRFDGMLGVVAAIACVEALARRGRRFPFAIEVLGFSDEEGVRFGSVLAGSRATAGTLQPASLARRGADGVSLGEAMTAFGLDLARIPEAARGPGDVLAYVELHIEQGPVLQRHGLALGCVTAIAGVCRLRVVIEGRAGHSGTVPMPGRCDALAAAAACVLAVERISLDCGTVGTVGELEVAAAAANVIPGRVTLTVDLRSGEEALLARAADQVAAAFDRIAAERGVRVQAECLSRRSPVPCAPWLMRQVDAAVTAVQGCTLRLPSGAGHDGMFMAAVTAVGMIFVRCTDGISHHPDEFATAADIGAGAAALLRFIEDFQPGPRDGIGVPQ